MKRDLVEKLKFLEDNRRHKALFLLLLRSEGFVTSESLAEKLNVTSRTVKSDIKYLSESLPYPSISIHTVKSKGVYVELENEDTRNEIKEYFQIYQEDSLDNDFEQRVQYILRRLLVSSKPVKIESIQDELYLNTSNYLFKEKIRTKEFLNQYKLELVTKIKQGLLIEGANFNKYLCMVRLYKYFDKDVVPEFKIDDFTDLFTPKFATKNEIRTVICQSILKTRLVFSDIHLERFVMFYILLTNIEVTSKDISNEIENMKFDYMISDEFNLVKLIDEELNRAYPMYTKSGKQFIQFMSYMAIISTDLYRTRDCVDDKYGVLINLAQDIRLTIIRKFEEVFKVCVSDDIVFLKDLLKVLIPIAMKIELGVSDDVDLGFYNHKSMNNKPIMTRFVESISYHFIEQYAYVLSLREKYLLINVIYEFINNIELSHKRFKIAIIAIDGRISTQQLKFCIKKYFPTFIDTIETKVLYELHEMNDHEYDCYFCMDYGKNMNIPYKPIYFFEEGLSDNEYYRILQSIFLNSYDYNAILPKIEYEIISPIYIIEKFPIKKHFQENAEYFLMNIGKNNDINLYFCSNTKKEEIKVFYFNDNHISVAGIKNYIVINTDMNYNKQKLKMILKFVNKIVENEEILRKNCNGSNENVNSFFL